MSDGGKGSKPRPISLSQLEYDTRWDAIFGRDLEVEEKKKREEALNKKAENARELGLEY
jgi:hypothetical protein